MKEREVPRFPTSVIGKRMSWEVGQRLQKEEELRRRYTEHGVWGSKPSLAHTESER